MSKINAEISQLIDKDGNRPRSNVDALKLHSFYSNLPIYRNKYDWKVPLWTKEELTNLHLRVKIKIIDLITSELDIIPPKMTYFERERYKYLLNPLSSKELYHIYLNYHMSCVARALHSLIHSDSYETIKKKMENSSNKPLDVLKGVLDADKSAHLDPDSINLGTFWSSVTDDLNEGCKGVTHFKISMDCCTKFLNSTSDGQLITDVDNETASAIRKFVSDIPDKDTLMVNAVANAESLGVTVYQYMRVLLRKKQTSKWTQEEDAKLSQEVLRELGADNDFIEVSEVSPKTRGFPWKSISRAIRTKTPEQCRLRWRNLSKKSLEDVPFNELEFLKLKLLFSAFGPKWSKIASLLPNRNAVQCRNKLLSKSLKNNKGVLMDILERTKKALADGNAKKIPITDKHWKGIDPLGVKLVRIVKLIPDPLLLSILRDFYDSNELESRIDAIVNGSSKVYEKCSGTDVYITSEYLRQLASGQDSKVTNIILSTTSKLVKELLQVSLYAKIIAITEKCRTI
ncbi:hypothetical protein BEWA_000330 [Theileria equi strain WA]|uniref:Uncharacterized protein n=1 Tax=Theileria equi strain WA TaxID=1537102 RepID=L0AZD5_THEEQ|nr:hypothetical protein BEWA_000330 [Theileria equi strain WA]AFZ80628.1 hypothetical protein BEWA_000330 [Theileria equi strain WA]|eukprot:XP_004830294.1 hypothetical protein BEWA_000330 [Theileria equi strain WA]